MSEYQRRGESFAAGLGLGTDEALALLREFARTVRAKLQHCSAGEYMRQLVSLVEAASEGDPEMSETLGLKLGYGPQEAMILCRAAAKHFVEQAQATAASGRRPAAWLSEELMKARRWRSEAEKRATEEMIRKEAEAYALLIGEPEMLADKDWLAEFRKRMDMRLPRD